MDIDCEAPWRLSHILKGHSLDVKAVTSSQVEDVEVIHSVSRDSTARSWYRFTRDEKDVFHLGATYQGQKYQNAVAQWFKGKEGMTIIGGLDARILVFRTSSSPSDRPRSSPVQVLQGHYGNVCHLRLSSDDTPETPKLLISSSWDTTSRVWSWNDAESQWKSLHLLKGHESAVWSSEVVTSSKGDEEYLTASADLFIRLWKGENINRIFSGHTDVVRSIAMMPKSATQTNTEPVFYPDETLFVTSSNDGSLRLWSLDPRRCPPNNPTRGGDALRVMIPKTSSGRPTLDLLYGVCSAGRSKSNSHRLVVSCGEDGFVRGWDIEEGKVVFEINQPISSVWGVASLPASGDLITAGSDANIRVFTQRYPAVQKFQNTMANQVTPVSDEDLAEHTRKCSELFDIKRRASVQAEVIVEQGAEPSRSSCDNIFEGKQYDAILKIDVSDDAEPLPLAINKGDDIHVIANAFLERHKLPLAYLEQLITFIDQVGPK